jgi:energy-coupling factor transporter ATP-binding protein EcfA2
MPNEVAPTGAFLRGKGIQRIRVEGLFGEYSYDLRVRISQEGHAPRFLLLYGDNGSGKTTVLNIVFYLLSHLDKEGHKSRVKIYPFKSVVVEFADGVSVAANRETATEGPYRFSIIENGSTTAATTYGQAHEGSARERLLKESRHDEEHSRILARLESLGLKIVFLRHTRKILTNVRERSGTKIPTPVAVPDFRHTHEEEDEAIQGLNLHTTVYMLNRWVTERAFRGAMQGEEDVNELFSEIILTLARPDANAGESLKARGLGSLVSELTEQRDRYLSFSQFGLVKPLRLEPLLAILRGLPAHVHHSVTQVLSPYVNSLKARLDALEPVRVRFATFVDLVNSFYRNKTVHLDVYRGLAIRTRRGEPLKIAKLSSGEGQLLYLLTNLLVTKDRSTIFMVDEPELSLNVKWQRQLLRSLLKLTEESEIQFIFATHSIELLSRHREFVAELDAID